MGYQMHTLFLFCFLGLALATELTTYEKRKYTECSWALNDADTQPFRAHKCGSGKNERDCLVCDCSHYIETEDDFLRMPPRDQRGTNFPDDMTAGYCQRKGTSGNNCRFYGSPAGSSDKKNCLIEMIVKEFQYKVGEGGVDRFLSESESRQGVLEERSCPDPPNGCRVENLNQVVVPQTDSRRRRLQALGHRHERKIAWRRRRLQTETIGTLVPSNKQVQLFEAEERCLNNNLMWSGKESTILDCAVRANDLNAVYFSYKGNRENCEIPDLSTASGDCTVDSIIDVPVWAIYIIIDPESTSEPETTTTTTANLDIDCGKTADCPQPDSFCNFDDGSDSGTCEYCQDIDSCEDENFLTEYGFAQCIEVCENDTYPPSTYEPSAQPSASMPSPTPGYREVTIFERLAVRVRMSNYTYANNTLNDTVEFAEEWNEALTTAGLNSNGGIDGYEVLTDGSGVGEQSPCIYFADELCNGSTTNTDLLDSHRACRNYYDDMGNLTDNCPVGEYCPNLMNSDGTEPCEVCPAVLDGCETQEVEEHSKEYCAKCADQPIYDYPRDLNKMIRIMHDDRGGTESRKERFEGMKKRIRHALSTDAMLDGEPMFYKQQWRKMQSLTKVPYDRQNFYRLGYYLDELVSFWEDKYGNRYGNKDPDFKVEPEDSAEVELEDSAEDE